MKIEFYISRLLWEHDCVILPGLGGLVANPRTAALLKLQKKILPPGKQLSFNRALTQNDGLLIHAVSRGEGMRYEDAANAVRDQITSWQQRMQKGERIRIEDVGRFFSNSQGNIFFEPAGDVHFTKSSFGLSPVIAPRIELLQPEDKTAVPVIKGPSLQKKTVPHAKEEAGIARLPAQGKKQPLAEWKIAAALPIFILVGAFLGWTLTQFRGPQPGLDFATMEMPHQETLRTPEVATIEVPAEKASRPADAAPVEAGENEPIHESPETTGHDEVPSPPVAPNDPSSFRFHLIGGCFSSRKNAEKLLRDLQREGYDAVMAGQSVTGLYRVSYGGFVRRNEAEHELEALRLHKKPVWMLSL